MHEYVRNHLKEVFQSFRHMRYTFHSAAGPPSLIRDDFRMMSKLERIYLIDSMPAMTADAWRSGRAKAAREIAEKGHDAVKNAVGGKQAVELIPLIVAPT